MSVGCVTLWTLLSYRIKHKYVSIRGLQLPKKLPSSTQLRGKHKIGHFYPKIRTQPIYSEADSETKDNKYLYISVTYGV